MLVGGTPTSDLPASHQFFCFSVSPLLGGCSSQTWLKSSSGLRRSASASSKLRNILRPDRGRLNRSLKRCTRQLCDAVCEGWESEDCARLLAPLLTGEAQGAYFALPSAVSDTYSELKKEILARLGLSPVCAAQYFHDWEYKPRLPARAQAAELSRLYWWCHR